MLTMVSNKNELKWETRKETATSIKATRITGEYIKSQTERKFNNILEQNGEIFEMRTNRTTNIYVTHNRRPKEITGIKVVLHEKLCL